MTARKRLLSISWCVLLCVLLFILLYGGSALWYSLQRARQIETWNEKLSTSLDKIENFHSDERFFCYVFQTAFSEADASQEPLSVCKTQTDALKKRFDGKVSFVIFDEKGTIDAGLSDRQGYKYIFKAMYDVVSELTDHLKTAIDPVPEKLDIVKKRIKLLRGYFGQFMTEKILVSPLLSGRNGACISVSEDPANRLLWYQKFRNFTVIAFADKALTGRNIGSEQIAKQFNSEHQAENDIKLGYYTPLDMLLHGNTASSSELLTSVTTYSRTAVNFTVTDTYLLYFRYLAPDLIAFASVKRAGNLIEIDAECRKILTAALKGLVLLLVILFLIHTIKGGFVLSVRQKLLLIFLLAALMPVLFLFVAGAGYFEQKKAALQNEVYERSLRIMKDADSRYPAEKEAMAKKFNGLIGAVNDKFGAEKWSDEYLEKVMSAVAVYKPSFIIAADPDGNSIYKKCDEYYGSEVCSYFSKVLKFVNNKSPDYAIPATTFLEELTDDAWLYADSIDNLGKFTEKGFGAGTFQTYVNLLGNRSSSESWGIAAVGWRNYELQRAYFSGQLEAINAEISPMKLVLMEEKSERIFPEKYNNNQTLKRLMRSCFTKKFLKKSGIYADGTECIAAAMCSTWLSNTVLAVIYPQSLIDAQVDRMILSVAVLLGLSLLMLFFIVYFFADRLLQPAAELEKGLTAIAEGNYAYRSRYSSSDEFGSLIASFNEAAESLGEMAVGTEVQKSLLPDDKYQCKNLDIFAHSIFMNKMGGDYFDYYRVSGTDLICIFFGDVAGHGIPAAVMAAAAKAVFASFSVLAPDRIKEPAVLLKSINDIFLKVKERKCRRMMTALCLLFDAKTGEYCISNAGQTYPAVLSQGSVTYVKAAGMPLGTSRRSKWVENRGQLKPGDTMILYSDGIVESLGADGTVFGFDRFEALLKKSQADDPQGLWKNIISGYRDWAPVQDDDITFMILKYKGQQDEK